jgi:hypothetical protein
MRRAAAIAGFVALGSVAILLAARLGPGAAGALALVLALVLVALAASGRV